MIDVRQNFEYGEGHIPNSINIGLGGQFASWAGTLIPIGTPIAIVADNETSGRRGCHATRQGRARNGQRIGFDGQFHGRSKEMVRFRSRRSGNCSKPRNSVRRCPPDGGACKRPRGGRSICRSISLPNEIGRLDPQAPTYVICQGGYRSSLGTSA
ncbi:MAG: rhodanese-like domain-containing protein [Acidobacteria bacterium]|nr:rhodanese-like domain-containing protein [Acidobacteriota bacterium]